MTIAGDPTLPTLPTLGVLAPKSRAPAACRPPATKEDTVTLIDTILEAILDAHVPLTLDDLDVVVAGMTGSTPNPDDVDTAVGALLELELVEPRDYGPDYAVVYVEAIG